MMNFKQFLCLSMLMLGIAAPGSLQAEDTIDNPRSLTWNFSWNYTQKNFEDKMNELKTQGFRVQDLEIYPSANGETWFAATFQKNDDRQWWAVWRYQRDEFDQIFDKYMNEGYRLIDFEIIDENGTLRYSAVWIENKEGYGWGCRFNLKPDQFRREFAQYKADGYRPIDLEVYEIDGETYFACTWVENRDKTAWEIVWGYNNDEFQDKYNEMAGESYRPIEMEAYLSHGSVYYAGIWNRDPTGRCWHARWGLSNDEFRSNVNEFSEGHRPIDFYYLWDGQNAYYGIIWQNNMQTGSPRHRN